MCALQTFEFNRIHPRDGERTRSSGDAAEIVNNISDACGSTADVHIVIPAAAADK